MDLIDKRLKNKLFKKKNIVIYKNKTEGEMKRYVCLLTIVLLTCVCITIPAETLNSTTYNRKSETSAPLSDIYRKSFHESWQAVTNTLKEMGLVIKENHLDQERITTEFAEVTPDNLDDISTKPFIPNAIWSKGRYSLTVEISSINEKTTKVTILTHVEGYEDNTTEAWHLCQAKQGVANLFYSLLYPRLADGYEIPEDVDYRK